MGSILSKKSEEPPKAQTGKAKRASLPSPAAPAATAKVPADDAHATGFSAAFEERIRRFYAHYSPDKVDTVPVILRHWTETEEELIQTLVERYGPELNEAAKTPAPPLTENAADDAKVWESRFARQLLAYRPERLSRLRRILERAKGREESTLMSFINQMGPEPQGPLPDPLHDTTRIPTNEASRKTVQEEVDPQPAVVKKAEQPAEAMETPSTIKT
ncbi:hypothetical protein TcBrA4_0034140 [Trypanosoma cruzi]|nr:hypothetical protein TcBrA4_0034140 [Trypanosoma cruzi]